MQKSVYRYEYIDDWETIMKHETSLPEKQCFHSHLNMEDITDVDYRPIKIVCKNFEIFTRISWFVCSKQYIIVSYFIWEL